MNVVYFGAGGTEDYFIYKILYSHKEGDYHVDFKIIEPYNGDEEDIVFSGYIKWDGCSNWDTDKNCSIHFCGLDGLYNFNECLKECYRIAKSILGDDCE
jgi:hypothetical protein